MDKVTVYEIFLQRCKDKKLCDLEGVINRHVFKDVLGICFKIPKEKQSEVIKDMKKRGLIDELNKFKIKIFCF